jgi:hypothetical protein
LVQKEEVSTTLHSFIHEPTLEISYRKQISDQSLNVVVSAAIVQHFRQPLDKMQVTLFQHATFSNQELVATKPLSAFDPNAAVALAAFMVRVDSESKHSFCAIPRSFVQVTTHKNRDTFIWADTYKPAESDSTGLQFIRRSWQTKPQLIPSNCYSSKVLLLSLPGDVSDRVFLLSVGHLNS